MNDKRYKAGSMNVENKINRNYAYQLLESYITSKSLLQHSLAVESIMKHFSERYKGDENEWGIIGLVHDIDYERFPNEHCIKADEILSEAGFPDHYIRAVKSHGWGAFSDVKPETPVEKVLYAIDELSGLIHSVARIRPSGILDDLKVKSVSKKFKDKNFASGVDRNVIKKGADMLGMELSELIRETIEGMKKVSEEIGFAG
jgi:putative nucleotidyltransferase with HDIG domain